MRRLFFGLAILVIGISSMPSESLAQTTSATKLALPAQLGPTDFLNASLHVTALVDRFEMAAIWESSSPIMKATTTKDRFVANTAMHRAKLGSIATRDWTAIMRVVIAETSGALPPGRYMTVRFTTTGRSGLSMEEVVSFHLADDGQWKLAGYSIN